MPGARGNCVIAGHRDTHFRVLKDIRKGDDIVLETSRGRFLYRVDDNTVVLALGHSCASAHPAARAHSHHLLPVLLRGLRRPNASSSRPGSPAIAQNK